MQPTLVPEGTHRPDATVVLLGSTGSGKSALGNYLYKWGLEDAQIFPVGLGAFPETQQCAVKDFTVAHPQKLGATLRVRVIDTPGLNEADPDRDLAHMTDLLDTIQTLGKISCVMLCVPWNFKLDRQNKETFAYYKELFRPAFEAGNFVLVFTKVSPSDYGIHQERSDWSDTLQLRVQECSRELGLPIAMHMYLNSMERQDNLREMLAEVEKGVYKDTLIFKSFLTRQHILSLLSQLGDVSLKGHFFPLPPPLEDLRKHRIALLSAALEQLATTLRIENAAHAERIERMGQVNRDVSRHECKIRVTSDEIAVKSGIQRTPEQYRSGTDIIRFRNAGTFQFHSPVRPFTFQATKWNCDFEEASRVPAGSGDIVTVKVQPDFFSPTQKNSANWYIRMWVEYDGKEHYRELLNTLNCELADARALLAESQRILDELYHRAEADEASLKSHATREQEWQRIIQLLSRGNGRVRLEEVPALIAALKEKVDVAERATEQISSLFRSSEKKKNLPD